MKLLVVPSLVQISRRIDSQSNWLNWSIKYEFWKHSYYTIYMILIIKHNLLKTWLELISFDFEEFICDHIITHDIHKIFIYFGTMNYVFLWTMTQCYKKTLEYLCFRCIVFQLYFEATANKNTFFDFCSS